MSSAATVMNADRPRVVIVGGGSAGWMTAAYLSRAFGPRVEISLIESAAISTVGVGEATFSDIHLFLDFLGLTDEEWMKECNAAYKVAIRFVNWRQDGRSFYHPFERPSIVGGRNLAEWWLGARTDRAYDEVCFVSSTLCDARRSPRHRDGRTYDMASRHEYAAARGNRPLLFDDLQNQYPYGYHFDASLFGAMLGRYARARGVRHVVDDVVQVRLTESGSIAGIETKQRGYIPGDLFVDCTGFRGLLINQALGEPFVSFLDSLPCDRAVAMQVPRPVGHDISPYTSATALSAGWVWNIPLYHRTGTGYVYSSACLSPEAAEREFRAHLGQAADGGSALHIKMRVGRCRNSWVKNCVAVGLSSGFVEPLESTGLFFTQYNIEHLVSHFPRGVPQEETIRSFNRIVGDCIDGVREFLTLHYVASDRCDAPFWKLTKHELLLPGGLAERLQLWKRQLPTRRTIPHAYHGFGPHNYSAMLLGLGRKPSESLAVIEAMDATEPRREWQRIRRRADVLARTLPSQGEYLAWRYGEQSQPALESATARH